MRGGVANYAWLGPRLAFEAWLLECSPEQRDLASRVSVDVVGGDTLIPVGIRFRSSPGAEWRSPSVELLPCGRAVAVSPEVFRS